MAESGNSTRVFQEGWTALRENPILAVPPLVALLIVGGLLAIRRTKRAVPPTRPA